MDIPISSSIHQVSPSRFFQDGFELSDQSIIPSEEFQGSFTPNKDIIEFFIYDFNHNLIHSNSNFINWVNQESKEELQLNPQRDIYNAGFDNGTLFGVYNFTTPELSSSFSERYFISEISADRTEIRLQSNFLDSGSIESAYNNLKTKLDTATHFDEFYLNFGNNQNLIGVNILLDSTSEPNSILVKLYESLPSSLKLKDETYVITKVAETKMYEVSFINEPFIVDDLVYLKGPNTNLEIKDFLNNSTELKSKNELLRTDLTHSYNQFQNLLGDNGVELSPNYSKDTFDEFVHFSSAKQRIENFHYKVGQIEDLQNDLFALNSITGSTSQSVHTTTNRASISSSIGTIIKNFDGYDYFLYYGSGSSSYPKTGSSYPYGLLGTGSEDVLTWLGSTSTNSPYYGGMLYSASIYDFDNQDWLYWTIPDFIKDNRDNDPYLTFSNMVGQHFDELWLYTKAVTDKLDATNVLDKGIPLEMAEDAVKSFGYEGFGNNYNNQDVYTGFLGVNPSGGFVPPVGEEVITNYVAINSGSVSYYWQLAYSHIVGGLHYAQPLIDPGFPYPIDRVSKEIFKRLYHNMAYLVKKKGTISGLRQLINIWGIPNTILRINEFGGKNKDNTDDYDLWYNRYSYAFTPHNGTGTQTPGTASIRIPWQPLERNRIADSEYIVPDCIQFRFKTEGVPPSGSPHVSQSLIVKKSNSDNTSTDFDFGIVLNYSSSLTGSYSGSALSDYATYASLSFYLSGSTIDGGDVKSDDIYLPFFDKGWWSVMLQRDQHLSASVSASATTFTLYAKNKIYNGYDGNQIGFEGNTSIAVPGSNTSQSWNEAWNKFGTSSADGVYLGGFVSGSVVGDTTLSNVVFSGSLQEFRYYAYGLSESIFNDYVMNPESIEGINLTGSLSSFDILNFRAPLGNELENQFVAVSSSLVSSSISSSHPAISGSYPTLVTGSFVTPGTNNVT